MDPIQSQLDLSKAGSPPAGKSRSNSPWSALQWVLAGFLVVVAIVVSNGAASMTNALFEALIMDNDRKSFRTAEDLVRSELPKSAGPGVSAVDVRIDQRGIRWTYQTNLTSDQISAAMLIDFGNELSASACNNKIARNLLSKNAYLEYELVDRDGMTLTSRKITTCVQKK